MLIENLGWRVIQFLTFEIQVAFMKMYKEHFLYKHLKTIPELWV